MSNEHFEGGKKVSVSEFNHAEMDSPEDVMRERLEMGMAALDICEEFLKTTARAEAFSILSILAAEAVKEKRTGYVWDQFMWLSGFAGQYGISSTEIANGHGVSKQAFLQAANRLNKKFNFPKTSAQRSDEARENMSNAYHLTHDK
jgi:hypothetical protein